MSIFPENYRFYEIQAAPMVGKHIVLCGSEEEAIAQYRKTYPKSVYVFASAVERKEEE